jgi:membrane protein
VRSRGAHARFTAGDFARRVVKKADQDQIFFMAGAIAFNIMVAVVPLMLAVLGVAGLILQSRYGVSAEEPLVRYILEALPPVSAQFDAQVRTFMRGLLEQSSGFVGIGTLIFAWFATRLIGTLRTALREIFDIQQDRGIIAGKLFDIKMVIAAGTLLAVNVTLTVLFELVRGFGYNILGLRESDIAYFNQLSLRAVAFLSIWTMFLLIYRYLPARRIQWRTALVGATFTAIFIELLKQAFALYVTMFADYSSTYANLANFFVVILWVYYSAIIFILGGEVAQVTSLRRIRRRQKERLG